MLSPASARAALPRATASGYPRAMKRIWSLVLLLFALAASPALACDTGTGSGERGVALLVGISEYRAPAGGADGGWSPLANAVHDIDTVCGALTKAGFKVFIARDPDFTALDSTIADFHVAALDAPNAVVYYAGHGFEYAGKQFLVPVDAPLTTDRASLTSTYMPLARLLDAATSAQMFSLFLMDACRTREPVVKISDADPGSIEGGAVNIGLFTVPSGAVIFSTVAGRPAFDDAPAGSRNSPFARAVADSLSVPGLELADFYENLHNDVVSATESMLPKGPQYPALYKISPTKFYLVDPPRDTAAPTRKPRMTPQAVGNPARPAPLDLPPLAELATIDEPVLVRRVLGKYDYYKLQAAGAQGDAVAQYLLGYMHHFGVGAVEDRERARAWLELSAKQGHPAGQLELAYFLDKNAPAEAAQARELYEQAAAQNYAKAQSHLAFLLWNAPAGEREPDRARELWQAAAAQGHVYANFALALYIPAERTAAMNRLREISAAGNAEGDNWLCELHYFAGKNGEHPQYCVTAALSGNSGARAIYAQMCATGDGVERSASKALYWARLALSQPELRERPDLLRQTRQIAEEIGGSNAAS